MNVMSDSIKIKDFFFIILINWRRILVFSLLGAILISSIGYINNESSSTTIQNSKVELSENEIEAIKKDVLLEDAEAIHISKDIEFLQQRKDWVEDKIANSILLQIDYQKQPMISFVVAINLQKISGENEDQANQREYLLAQNYTNIVRSDSFYNYLAAANDYRIKSYWIKELVKCTLLDDNNILVEITAHNDQLLSILDQATKDYLLNEAKLHLTYSYVHKSMIVNENKTEKMNPSIQTIQKNTFKEFNDLQRTIILRQSELEKIIDKAIEDEITKSQHEKDLLALTDSKSVVNTSKLKFVKHLILGFLLGFFIGVSVSFFRSRSKDQIFYPELFAEETGLLFISPVRGVMRESIDEKKFGHKIDVFIKYIFYGYKESNLSTHQAIEYGIMILQGRIKSSDFLGKDIRNTDKTSELCIASLGEDESGLISQVISLINEAARNNEDGLSLCLTNESLMLDRAESIKTLAESDAVILFIVPRETRIKNTTRAIEIAKNMGKPILGVFSIEERYK
jgi:hypothetical protein